MVYNYLYFVDMTIVVDRGANSIALGTILEPRILCVDALYKLTSTYLLTYLLEI